MLQMTAGLKYYSHPVPRFDTRLFLVSRETAFMQTLLPFCPLFGGDIKHNRCLTRRLYLKTFIKYIYIYIERERISPWSLSLSCESPSLVLDAHPLQMWSKEKMSAHQVFQPHRGVKETNTRSISSSVVFEQLALWLRRFTSTDCVLCAGDQTWNGIKYKDSNKLEICLAIFLFFFCSAHWDVFSQLGRI